MTQNYLKGYLLAMFNNKKQNIINIVYKKLFTLNKYLEQNTFIYILWLANAINQSIRHVVITLKTGM